MNSSEELTRFKTNINLIDYAASLGYSIDQRKSSSSNVVMRNAHGDAICITLHRGTHEWVYWSFGDDADKGTVIDFVQKRRRLTLGEVRKELRTWCGDVHISYVHPVLQSSLDFEAIHTAYNQMEFIQEHPYLIHERCIPLSTLHHPKFVHRIKIDSHNNAIFPHFSDGQVCGYEIKNACFTGFSTHGKKRIVVFGLA